MTAISRNLCWAGSFIALAVANRFGLVADTNAATIFVILPALWVATGELGRCSWRKAAV
ncbi:MAG: hypothetical protein ABL914_02290 [Novosphingobium sp.]|uniref:hypothetical protein n=1 Tax=Novosphingobium sp. TaxID=1874826 RepID=UPI0032BCAFC1